MSIRKLFNLGGAIPPLETPIYNTKPKKKFQESKKKVIFRCQELTHSEHEAIIRDSSSIVHMKGFGIRLKDISPPSSLMAKLHDADVVVWDGDSFSCDSFTKSIVALVAGFGKSESHQHLNSPKLLVYRLDHDSSGGHAHHSERLLTSTFPFLNSWDNKAFSVLEDAFKNSLVIHPITSSEIYSDNIEPIACTIFYYILKPLPMYCRDYFMALGVQALQTTRSQCVVALGGGKVVQAEMERLRSSKSLKVTWHVWPIQRQDSSGKQEKAALLELASTRPNIIVEDLALL